MAKNEGKPTSKRCTTCHFDKQYPDEEVTPPKPIFFCNRLTGASWAEAGTRTWIQGHSFNAMGQPVGLIVEACPGYEEKI